METAAAEQAEWPDQVAAALVAILRFFTESPEAARVCLVDSAALGAAIRPRLDQAVERMVAMLGLDGAQAGSSADRHLEPIEEPVVTGVFAMLSGRVTAGESDLEQLAGEVIESVLGPYLGYEEAGAVAARHTAPTPD